MNDAVSTRIKEAEAVLRDLGLHANDRNALTLLALLNLKPDDSWAQADRHTLRISEIINFIEKYYGIHYAPNSRESIRKQSVQVFRDEGLVQENPDQKRSRTNANFSYQIAPDAQSLLKTFRSADWQAELERFRTRKFPTPSKLRRWLAIPSDQIRLTALRLSNFRSLLDTGWVEMRPLLVLVGRNSSGKSSFLRFFPLLRQTIGRRSASPLLWYAPDADVDFGNFSTVLWRAARPRELRIGMKFDFHGDGELQPIQVEADLTLGGFNGSTSLRTCLLRCLGQEAQLRFSDDGILTAFTSSGKEVQQIGEGYAALREPGQLFPRLTNASEQVPKEASELAQVVPDLLAALNQWMTSFAASIHYSGPVRETPHRLYRPQEVMVSQIDPTGGNLAMFISSLSEAQQRAFSDWVEKQFGFKVVVEPDGLNIVIHIEEHGQRNNLIDMGYGFSQVLPILAQSWASLSMAATSPREPPPSFLAMEQPELHLHPYHQERLADVFAALANQPERPLSLVLETHSEILVNRFGELIASGELARDRVLVLLFEKDARTGATEIRRSEYDERGFLKDWPVGFFAS